MKPNIALSDTSREAVAKVLNTLLADEYVLYTKTRNCHWNVAGPHFNDLHKFFEAQYEELDDFIDDIAERARQLGAHSVATLEEFHKNARIKEQPGKYPHWKDMLSNLLHDHETMIRQLREDLQTCAEKHGDMGNSDFLTGLMEKHEKMAWMLRAFHEEK